MQKLRRNVGGAHLSLLAHVPNVPHRFLLCGVLSSLGSVRALARGLGLKRGVFRFGIVGVTAAVLFRCFAAILGLGVSLLVGKLRLVRLVPRAQKCVLLVCIAFHACVFVHVGLLSGWFAGVYFLRLVCRFLTSLPTGKLPVFDAAVCAAGLASDVLKRRRNAELCLDKPLLV